jgi:hypothetical protein
MILLGSQQVTTLLSDTHLLRVTIHFHCYPCLSSLGAYLPTGTYPNLLYVEVPTLFQLPIYLQAPDYFKVTTCFIPLLTSLRLGTSQQPCRGLHANVKISNNLPTSLVNLLNLKTGKQKCHLLEHKIHFYNSAPRGSAVRSTYVLLLYGYVR